jgi:UDP-N-acetylglucosamine transferase subunit ALG13
MIFVAVGNARQGFRRLIEAVDEQVGRGCYGDAEVVIQTGHAGGETPRHCRSQAFFDRAEYQRLLAHATVVVCHGGFGTLAEAIRLGKRPVAIPRRQALGEHVNDHQRETVAQLAEYGLVVPCDSEADLPAAVDRARGNPVPHALDLPSLVPLVRAAIVELIGEPGAPMRAE